MGLIDFFRGLARDDEAAETDEANILMYGFAKIINLLTAVRDKDYSSARRILRGGKGIGLRYFTRQLLQKKEELLKHVGRSSLKANITALTVHINHLVVLLSPRTGSIPKMLKCRDTDWNQLEEKVREAKTAIEAAIAEERTIRARKR